MLYTNPNTVIKKKLIPFFIWVLSHLLDHSLSPEKSAFYLMQIARFGQVSPSVMLLFCF